MVRIAACQIAPKATLEARKEQIHQMLQKADQGKIDFLCFPEGFLTGYYSDEALARNNAFETHGVFFQKFLSELMQYRTTIIMGFNEREGNRIFDSVAAIESGQLLGIQRKHYLYHNYFTPGESYLTNQSKGISFGIIVCLDSNYFEPARLLALQGAVILFCPMCNKVPLQHSYAQRPPYYSQFVARAHENRCWLVAADWIWAYDGKMTCPGHSCIYDPNGQEISRSQEGQEELLVVDIPEECLFPQKGRRMHGSQTLFLQLANMSTTDWKN